MDSQKFTKPATDLDKEETTRNESCRALAAIDGWRYTALRMWSWSVWPSQGQIQEELRRLDRMPQFERDALLDRAGFPTRRGGTDVGVKSV